MAKRVGGASAAHGGVLYPPGQLTPLDKVTTGNGTSPTMFPRVVGGALAATVLLAGCGSGGDEDGAVAYCHQFVEDRLKLPDTADFPSFPDHQVTETGEQQWRVGAWVEAENSFGGTVRTDWTCEISYDEAAGEWTLVDLSGL